MPTVEDRSPLRRNKREASSRLAGPGRQWPVSSWDKNVNIEESETKFKSLIKAHCPMNAKFGK